MCMCLSVCLCLVFCGMWCDAVWILSLLWIKLEIIHLPVSVWICFSVDKFISVGMNAACAFEPFYCHFVMVVLLLLSFQKMICVSNCLQLFWSVRKECYTIGKSGLKHRERQNSQSWAHKLHWCGIIWSFACGASLLPVLYSSFLIIYLILNWPLIALYFAKRIILYIYFCFNFVAVGLCLVVCTYLVFSCFTLCVFLSL